MSVIERARSESKAQPFSHTPQLFLVEPDAQSKGTIADIVVGVSFVTLGALELGSVHLDVPSCVASSNLQNVSFGELLSDGHVEATDVICALQLLPVRTTDPPSSAGLVGVAL